MSAYNPTIVKLRETLEAAQKRRDLASTHFDQMIKEAPSEIPHPHSTLRVRCASREYRESLADVWGALAKLNEYILGTGAK